MTQIRNSSLSELDVRSGLCKLETMGKWHTSARLGVSLCQLEWCLHLTADHSADRMAILE